MECMKVDGKLREVNILHPTVARGGVQYFHRTVDNVERKQRKQTTNHLALLYVRPCFLDHYHLRAPSPPLTPAHQPKSRIFLLGRASQLEVLLLSTIG